MSRKKVIVAIVIVASYFLVSAAIFTLASWQAAQSLKVLDFDQAKKYAMVARGAGYPFFFVNKLLQNPDLIVIEDGLQTLQILPDFAHNTQLILSTYSDHTPLTMFMLEPWRAQFEEILQRVQRFSLLHNRSMLVKRYVPNTFSELIEHNTHELQLFFLITDTVIERFKESRNYRILFIFQNNNELRATGGFPGSYGILTLSPGVAPTFEIQDIYVPDGQLTEHVDPPLPIQEAFQQGFWKLRDANWHPDFPSSAENILWFFEKGTGEQYDAVIAINFSFIESLLQVTGPIYLPDKNTEVNLDNVYTLLQRTDSDEFFAGSTDKKDTLSSFATQLQYTLINASLEKKLLLLDRLKESLQIKDVQLFFQDQPIQIFAQTQQWTGELRIPDNNNKTSDNILAINESNLGVNKANCCIQKETELIITYLPDKQTSILHLKYTNPLEVEPKYEQVAGAYKAYVRMYMPLATTVSSPIIQGMNYSEFIRLQKNDGLLHPEVSEGFSLEQVFGYTELGFWVVVPQGQELHITINTEHHNVDDKPPPLYIVKQSGVSAAKDDWNVIQNNNLLYSGPLHTNLMLPKK